MSAPLISEQASKLGNFTPSLDLASLVTTPGLVIVGEIDQEPTLGPAIRSTPKMESFLPVSVRLLPTSTEAIEPAQIALDAKTGKRIWHFQTTHHDLWDHDLPCPPVICQIKRNGRSIDAVAQPTKTGHIFLFDRKTGKPLYDVTEIPAQPSDLTGEQAWPTQPVPVKPLQLEPQMVTEANLTNISTEAHAYALELFRNLRAGKSYIPPSVQGSLVSPGFHGGATWSGASFDPTNNYLYINTNNAPFLCKMNPDGKGGYDFAGYTYFNDKEGYPAVKPPWGNLTAINLNTGEFAWRIPFGEHPALKAKGIPPTGTQNFGGTIVTGGGLVFIGATMDEKFHAFDKSTGKLLWEAQLPSGGYATPSTYMANGKQYVVIAAGGGGKLGTKSGDSFIAYSIP
jgi:quinoprotein glucose dehydrogenase